jgi:hypothetical protein
MNIFVQPASTWCPPVRKFDSRPVSRCPQRPTWEDHAFSKTWQAAVLEYLQAHGNRPAKLWQVINEVAAESAPSDRSELRRNKIEILRAITELKRGRSIMRYRRKLIASLEVRSQVVPLDQLKGLYVART